MTDNAYDRQVTGDGALVALSAALDTFGGSLERWPAERRLQAQALLSRGDAVGQAARAALAEAQALDRLLARLAAIDGARLEALAARIADAACHERPSADIVPLTDVRRRPSPMQRRQGQGRWIASAVLAASLLVGIVIGPGSTGVPALQEAADTIGLGGFVEQLALGTGEVDQAQDEDVL